MEPIVHHACESTISCKFELKWKNTLYNGGGETKTDLVKYTSIIGRDAMGVQIDSFLHWLFPISFKI